MAIVGANNSISGLGASTVDGVGEWTATDHRRESDGFISAFQKRLSKRFRDYPQNAVGSSSLEAVLALVADYATMAASGYMGHYPGHVLINAGISDINTTDIGGRIAAMEAIVDAVMDLGALPWLTALTPADGTANATEQERKWRIQLRNLGYYLLARRRGLPFLNGRQRIVDPATGGWASGMGSDALHANAAGAATHGWDLAQEVIDSQTGYPCTPWLIDANDQYSDDAVKVDNPLFLTDTGSDGTPDGWASTTTALSAPTADEVAAGMVGNWYDVTGSGTRTVTGLTAGNVYYLAWRYKYAWTSGTPAVSMRARALTSGAAVVGDLIDDSWTSPMSIGGVVETTIDLPATADRIAFNFGPGGAGVLSIGQLTLVDLTAHGLSPYAFPAG